MRNKNKKIQNLKISQIKKFMYSYPSRSLILDDIYDEDGTLAMDIRSIVEGRKERSATTSNGELSINESSNRKSCKHC